MTYPFSRFVSVFNFNVFFFSMVTVRELILTFFSVVTVREIITLKTLPDERLYYV